MIGVLPLGGWSVGGDGAVAWGLSAPSTGAVLVLAPLDVRVRTSPAISVVLFAHPALAVDLAVGPAVKVVVVVACGSTMLPGNIAKLRAHFIDCDTKADVDPIAVRMILDVPGTLLNQGVVSTYPTPLGTSPWFTVLAFTQESAGHYLVTVLIPKNGYKPGRYDVRFEGDGNVTEVGAGEGFFDVEQSKVVS